ncbi:hypothetical protein [Falsirhodobacter algicola]|uniref:Phage protein n=1 Tax=Falsirhodobacter algicola TaxID=2692330 RepID=A0A8J8MTA6_9RHOB|nr:hypothetical protein [Falsirhodobacter algicola]QUS36082.1 hypothetical protein GR316_07250 [Falsirhodobacter algicola]
MKITLTPMRRDASLELVRTGDILTVNGTPYDFTPLPDGASLPAEAVSGDWLAGPVERIEGDLHLCVILPHGPEGGPSHLITLTPEGDGPIALPYGEAQ